MNDKKSLSNFLDLPTSKNDFYTVGTKIFTRDIDALVYASQTKTTPKYHLNFDIFKQENRYLWQVEPAKDIEYYFDKHASILNTLYDKIYLSYSGGTDSHTILNVFIKNNIKNVTLVNITETDPVNSKIYHTIKKPTDLISKKYRNTFINLNYKLVGYKENYLTTKLDPIVWEAIINHAPGAWNTHFNQINRSNVLLRYFNDNNSNILSLNDKDCIVYGYEKPYITIQNGWWGWQTHSNLVVYLDGRIPYYNNLNNVYFFISNEVPELQIKMAWNKIKKIKEILKNRKIKISAESVQDIQRDTLKYYIPINKAMGLGALSSSLETKAFAHQIYHSGNSFNIKIADPLANNVIVNEIHNINKCFYDNYIIKNVDSQFLNETDRLVKEIYSDFIPICKVDT